jgi:hypothetical protein
MAKLFEVEPHVRSMIDDDGAVLLDLKAGTYYSLNGIGAQVWLKNQAGEEESSIVSTLCESYGIQEAQVRSDIKTFMTGLVGKGLIRAST